MAILRILRFRSIAIPIYNERNVYIIARYKQLLDEYSQFKKGCPLQTLNSKP